MSNNVPPICRATDCRSLYLLHPGSLGFEHPQSHDARLTVQVLNTYVPASLTLPVYRLKFARMGAIAGALTAGLPRICAMITGASLPECVMNMGSGIACYDTGAKENFDGCAHTSHTSHSGKQ